MARKGQVFKKHSDKDRHDITMEYINGMGTYNSISKKYNISSGTLKNWVWKYKRSGTTNLKKRGRPRTSHLTELEKLKLENEILKKFQAFLNQQHERK